MLYLYCTLSFSPIMTSTAGPSISPLPPGLLEEVSVEPFNVGHHQQFAANVNQDHPCIENNRSVLFLYFNWCCIITAFY